MITPEILELFNKQIQQEFAAEYGYIALSAYFEQELLNGFAAYFRKQAGEEREHAMKLLDHVLDRGGEPSLGTIEAPRQQFSSPLDAVKHAQSMERVNTASIHRLYEKSLAAKDLATQQQLLWFIQQQVEEEKWADELVGQVERVGTHLFMLDHRVGKRAKRGDDERED
jgi:ferritin